jgi:hypothetical protein
MTASTFFVFAFGVFIGAPLGIIISSLLVANRLDPKVVKNKAD